MSPHKEISFETEICEHLGQHGWLYEADDAARYDRALALLPDDFKAAHAALDTAVDTTYAYPGKPDDDSRVAFLFNRYEALVKVEKAEVAA